MEFDRKNCVKTCPLRRRRNWFQRLFCLSYILTRIEIVLAVCIITGFTKFQLGTWSIDLSILPPLLNRTRFTGLKDIATTVGLTGVLFAWLLQIIGEKTCDITTDALFEWEYPHYQRQIFHFIQFTLVSIYTCGSEHAGRLLALLCSMGMLCGIINMWLMCATFLFSMKDRRQAAFCILRNHLENQWDQAALRAWAQELNTCADRNERAHIDTLFMLTVQKAVRIKEQQKQDLWPCAIFCGETMSTLWKEADAGRWHTYLPALCGALRQPEGKSVAHAMMAAYLIQAAKLSRNISHTDRCMSVLECLGRGIESLPKVPAYVLETYLAFLVIYQGITNVEIPQAVLIFLTKVKPEQPVTVDREERRQILMAALQSYAVNCTYDYRYFAHKHWDSRLLGNFNRYLNLL